MARSILFLLLLTLTACQGERNYIEVVDITYPIPENTHPRGGELQEILDDHLAQGFVGLTLLVDDPEQGFWTGSSGLACLETNHSLTPYHLHHLASVPKLYTAATLMLLVEDGHVDLDEYLSAYLPSHIIEHVDNGNRVTIRQMMNHTSGLYSYNYDPRLYFQWLNDSQNPGGTSEFLDAMERHDADFSPGSRYEYCDGNYMLLSLVIDEVSGQNSAQLMADSFFDPLGLQQTFYKVQQGYPQPPGLVNSYADWHNDGSLINISDLYAIRWAELQGDDGMIASAWDCAQFVRALFEGDLVSQSSLDEMVEFVDSGEADFTGYGLGVVKWESSDGELVGYGHSGSSEATGAQVYYFPEQETSIVLLTNTGVHWSDWGNRFARTLWPEVVEAAFR